MAKRVRPRKDEQWPLIDTTPENYKVIFDLAVEYREAQEEKCAWGEKAAEAKTQLVAAIRGAGITPNSDGSYRVGVDNCRISITPGDDAVKVQFKQDKE
jgi:hypothetical protein